MVVVDGDTASCDTVSHIVSTTCDTGGGMTTGPASARRRENARVRREEARERIVAAAEALLLERPYRELTVDLVMSEAGLSRTVFYRHFDGLPEVAARPARPDRVRAGGGDGRRRGRRLDAGCATCWPRASRRSPRYGPFLRALDHAAGQDAEIEAAYCAFVDRFTADTAEGMGGDERAYRARPGAQSDERPLPDGDAREGPGLRSRAGARDARDDLVGRGEHAHLNAQDHSTDRPLHRLLPDVCSLIPGTLG